MVMLRDRWLNFASISFLGYDLCQYLHVPTGLGQGPPIDVHCLENALMLTRLVISLVEDRRQALVPQLLVHAQEVDLHHACTSHTS